MRTTAHISDLHFNRIEPAVVEGLAGIQPEAAKHRADVFPSLPDGLDWFTLKNLRIGTHTVAVHVRRDAAGVTATLTHLTGTAPLEGRWRIASLKGDSAISKFRIGPGETIEFKS